MLKGSSSPPNRSSRSQMFFKIGVLKNFVIFTRKHLSWQSLFIKVAVLTGCNFIKKETPTQVFSCKYCEILRNSFFIFCPRGISLTFVFYSMYNLQNKDDTFTYQKKLLWCLFLKSSKAFSVSLGNFFQKQLFASFWRKIFLKHLLNFPDNIFGGVFL